MRYELMMPPKEIGDFSQLTKKEAKEHFEWFISQIPLRLEQLERYANECNNENIKFDKSIESLVSLWKWFEGIIETRERTKEELEEELSDAPEWLHDEIRNNNNKFTTLSLAIGLDIAIYFGETFVSNNPKVKWGYFSSRKKDINVNRPILEGFIKNMTLDPIRIINVCMSKSIDKRNYLQLFEVYNSWIKYINN